MIASSIRSRQADAQMDQSESADRSDGCPTIPHLPPVVSVSISPSLLPTYRRLGSTLQDVSIKKIRTNVITHKHNDRREHDHNGSTYLLWCRQCKSFLSFPFRDDADRQDGAGGGYYKNLEKKRRGSQSQSDLHKDMFRKDSIGDAWSNLFK